MLYLRKNTTEYFMTLFFGWVVVTFYTAPNIMTRVTWTLTLLVGFTYIIIKLIDSNIRKENIKIILMLTAWVLHAIMITPVALDKYIHFQLLLISVAYILFSIILISYLYNNNALLSSLSYIIFFWAIAEMTCLIFYVYTNGQLFSLGERFVGTYYNPNTLGVSADFLFAYLLVFRNVTSKSKTLNHVLLPVILVIAFYTESTKAVIGIFLISYSYISLVKRSAKNYVAFGFFVVILLSSLFLFSDASERLSKKIDRYSQWNEAVVKGGRPFLIVEGINLIKKHPITGVGVHNSQYYLYTPRYKVLLERGLITGDSPGVYSHNNYIEMGINAGILSILLYYIPIFFVLWKSYCMKLLIFPLKEVRIFIIITLLLKLFYDIGMVSYNSFIHIFMVSLCFILYYRLLRPNHLRMIREGRV